MPLFFSFRSETITDDEALELFKNCDKNGDGLISHNELKEVLRDVDVNLTDQAQYILADSGTPRGDPDVSGVGAGRG
jgi:Ca2+-binding EF-hand superfamily protein